jgi:O-antigen/teichoic acid export membrane protein
MKPILTIWLELTDTAGVISAIILLISMYIYVFFRSSSVHILLMTNNHKQLTKVAMMECTANLLISILLIRYIGIIGVALGTLIPNVIAAIFFNIPAGCKFALVKGKDFFRIVILRTFWIALVSAGIMFIAKQFFVPKNLLELLACFAISGMIYLTMYYYFGIYRWERKEFNHFIVRKLVKKKE